MTNIIWSGIFLILAGFALVFLGTIAGNAEFGGLIMIGPIPVAFGTTPLITIVAMVIGLMLMFFMLWRRNA